MLGASISIEALVASGPVLLGAIVGTVLVAIATTYLGMGLFRLLVVGIVSARAAYFYPDFARAFENVAAAIPHFIRSIFAV